jgi:hypothetical protein
MTYITAQDSSDGLAKVIYQSKDAKTTKTFDALDLFDSGMLDFLPYLTLRNN